MPEPADEAALERLRKFAASRRDISIETLGEISSRQSGTAPEPEAHGGGISALVGGALKHRSQSGLGQGQSGAFQSASSRGAASTGATKFVLEGASKFGDGHALPLLSDEQRHILAIAYGVSTDDYRKDVLWLMPKALACREELRKLQGDVAEAVRAVSQASSDLEQAQSSREEHERLEELLEARLASAQEQSERTKTRTGLMLLAAGLAVGIFLLLGSLRVLPRVVAGGGAAVALCALIPLLMRDPDGESPDLVEAELRALEQLIEQKIRPVETARRQACSTGEQPIEALEEKVAARRKLYIELLRQLVDQKESMPPRLDVEPWLQLKNQVVASLHTSGSAPPLPADSGRRRLLQLLSEMAIPTLLLQRAVLPRAEVNVDAFVAEFARYSSNSTLMGQSSEQFRTLLTYWHDRRTSEKMFEAMKDIAGIASEALPSCEALKDLQTADAWADAVAEQIFADFSSLPAGAAAVAEAGGRRSG